VSAPALADWARLDTYQPPWQLIRGRDFSFANRLADQSDRFILSPCCARPFERLQFLRGSQNLFIDIAYGTPELRRLLDLVHAYQMEDMRGWCSSNVDGILFMDDWGANSSLLINPKTWRELFKPLYQEYVDLIHAAGKFAFFHSDGCIQSIYADLVEIGIDAVNSQLFTMDIDELARLHKGKITFWGEIDRQHILPFGTPDEVRAAVRRVRAALDDGSGGVIAQCEWGKDNPIENVRAVYQAWME
jgi:uroporphyrinogen decarboxylase